MTDRDSGEKFDKGILKQSIGGQQSHASEYGEQADQTGDNESEEIKKEAFGGRGGQPIGGNDSRTGSGTPLTSGYGGASETSSTTGSGVGTPGGSAPPRSMGTHGTEFGQMSDHDRSGQQGQSGTGQADLGSQAGSTLSGHTDQQELGEIGGEVDQPGSYAGGLSGRQAAPIQGEGFIAQPSGDTDEILQETDEQAFAPEGQGATESTRPGASGDVEREADRDEKSDSNIEGGVG